MHKYDKLPENAYDLDTFAVFSGLETMCISVKVEISLNFNMLRYSLEVAFPSSHVIPAVFVRPYESHCIDMFRSQLSPMCM